MARRVPERTCVGCRGKAPKRDLIRMTTSPDGHVSVDRTGSAPGRGAYVHPTRECVVTAVKKGALARALRASIQGDEVGRLIEELEGAASR